MWKKICGIVLPFAAVIAIASPARAGSSSPTGTIALAASAQAPRYGGSVSFVTSTQGRIAPKASVYVRVDCNQGAGNVYEWSASPSFAFPLVDQPGQGLDWPGGAASCTGRLIYRVDGARGTAQITTLAQVAFAVAA